jgi:hypothetical protein
MARWLHGTLITGAPRCRARLCRHGDGDWPIELRRVAGLVAILSVDDIGTLRRSYSREEATVTAEPKGMQQSRSVACITISAACIKRPTSRSQYNLALPITFGALASRSRRRYTELLPSRKASVRAAVR